MISRLKGRDYISTQDWTLEELETALEVARYLKMKFLLGEEHTLLKDKTLFMLWFDKSTRTRNSFEAGMTQLGGHAHDLPVEATQIAHGEAPKDTGIILSRYGHGISIRHDKVIGEGNSYMREVARFATIPVINMQCDIDHPCQTLADIMTIREKFHGEVRGRKIAVCWAYAPAYARPLSVPQGLAMLMPRFGLDVTLVHPPELKVMPEVMEIARKNAEEAGVKFEVAHDMEEGVRAADIVYAKNWGVLESSGKGDETRRIFDQYTDWICDRRIMDLAGKNSIYMHCLPADRGSEVTDEVIDGRWSVVFDEAENRLHTAKAIMALTM